MPFWCYKEVVGLNVAMNYREGMDMHEGVCGLGHDRRRSPDSRVVPFQEMVQGDAVDQPHNDVGVGSVGALAEELGDARVPEASQKGAFAAEPAAKRREVLEPSLLVLNPGGVLVRAQELHGHPALGLQVACFPDLRHPAFADELRQLVTVLQDITRLHPQPPQVLCAVTYLAGRRLGE